VELHGGIANFPKQRGVDNAGAGGQKGGKELPLHIERLEVEF